MRAVKTMLFFIILINSVQAQATLVSGENTAQFAVIDNYASALKIQNLDIIQLTDSLTAPYFTELEQARAIFAWLGAHLAYDCGNENRLAEEPEVAVHPIYFTQQQLENILTTRRTRCDGYAFMFKLMCNLSGIYCSRLEGYVRFRAVKFDPDTVQPNHAWNAALLDGQWYEIDATAGAGQCAGQQFHRQLNDAYFGISAEMLEQQYIRIDDQRQTHNQGRVILKF